MDRQQRLLQLHSQHGRDESPIVVAEDCTAVENMVAESLMMVYEIDVRRSY